MGKERKALEAAARTGMVAEKEIEAKKKVQAGFHRERMKLERQLKRRRTDSDQKVMQPRIQSSQCLQHTMVLLNEQAQWQDSPGHRLCVPMQRLAFT